MWELPEFAYFLDRLAAMGRLIMFDKRGTGLSDRVAGMPTWEERADDITAVMDAAGSARPRSPHGVRERPSRRCSRRSPRPRDRAGPGRLTVKVTVEGEPVVFDPAVIQAVSAAVESGWGQASLARLAAPSRVDDTVPLLVPAVGAAVGDPERGGGDSPLGHGVQFAPLLPAIQARTLVLHRSGGALYDPRSVRAAATMIPDATCLELPGADGGGGGRGGGRGRRGGGRGGWGEEVMRIESSVTSVSWIPSEAVPGVTRIPFEAGVMHYDDPPPDEWTTWIPCWARRAPASPMTCGPG